MKTKTANLSSSKTTANSKPKQLKKTIKSVANSVKAEVNEELRIHELHNNLKKAEQQNMEDLAPALKDSVEELKKAAESVQHSYKQPAQQPPVEQKNDNQK